MHATLHILHAMLGRKRSFHDISVTDLDLQVALATT